MKNLYLVVCCIFSLFAQAQTAEIIFVNNKPTANAVNHTIVVTDANGAEVMTLENLAYQSTSGIIELPADQILNITYESSTGSTIATNNNAVLTADRKYVQFIGSSLTGGTSITRITTSTISPGAGSFRYNFRNGAYDIGEIDVIERDSGDKLVENLDEFDNSSIAPETYTYATDQITLDITPAEDNGNGICAFIMDANLYSGTNIILFTSGSPSDLKCFVLQFDATLTSLEKTDPIMSATRDIYANAETVKLFPNPTSDQLQVSIASLPNEAITLRALDLLGRTIREFPIGNERGEILLSVFDFPKGQYVLTDDKKLIRPVTFIVQ